MKKIIPLISLILVLALVTIIPASTMVKDYSETEKKEIEIIDGYAYSMGDIIVRNEDSFVYFNSDCYKVEAYSGKAEAFTGEYDGRYYEDGKNISPTEEIYKVSNGVAYKVFSDGTTNIAHALKNTIATIDDIVYQVKSDATVSKFTGVKDGKFYRNGILDTTDKYMPYQNTIYQIDNAGNATIYQKSASSTGTYQIKIRNVVYEVDYQTGNANLFNGVFEGFEFINGIVNISGAEKISEINNVLYSITSYGKATEYTGFYNSLIYKNGKLYTGLTGIGSYTYYAVNGVAQKGFHTVGGKKYYFETTYGRLQKNAIVGNSKDGYYYASSSGVIDLTTRTALSYNGKLYNIFNGKAYAVSTDSDKVMYRALKLVSSITKPSMTKAEKLKAVWNHFRTSYGEGNPRIPHQHNSGWQILYANDILVNGKGNCFSYGAAFAFCARAIGFNNCYACNSGGHGWAEVEGLVYDPEWSMHYHKYSYYGMSYSEPCDVNYRSGISPGYSWMHVLVYKNI